MHNKRRYEQSGARSVRQMQDDAGLRQQQPFGLHLLLREARYFLVFWAQTRYSALGARSRVRLHNGKRSCRLPIQRPIQSAPSLWIAVSSCVFCIFLLRRRVYMRVYVCALR